MIFLVISAILLSIATPLSLGLDNIAIGVGLLGLILVAKRIKFDIFDKIFASFQSVGIISALFSINFIYSIKKSRFLWHYLPYYIASRVDREKIGLLINILAVSAIIASFGMMFHAFTGIRPTHIPWHHLSSIHLLKHPIRADGFFHNPFTSVGILSILFFLYLGLSIFSKGLKEKVIYGSLALFVFPSLILALCRAYWIGFVVSLIIMPFLYKKYLAPKVISISILVVFVSMFFLVPFVHNRVETLIHYKRDMSAEIRLMLWRSGLEVFRDYSLKNKLIGCGNNHLFHYTEPYIKRNAKRKFGYLTSHFFKHSMHNLYLQILLQWGIIGLVVWIFMWSYVLYRNVIFINLTGNDFYRGLIIGLTAGFIAFLIGGFFEYNIGDSEIAIFFTYMLGINKNILDSMKEESS